MVGHGEGQVPACAAQGSELKHSSCTAPRIRDHALTLQVGEDLWWDTEKGEMERTRNSMHQQAEAQ